MLEGKSYVEISKILGCSKQNVSQLLKSAGNQVEIKSSSKQMFIPSLKKQEKITIKNRKKSEENRNQPEGNGNQPEKDRKKHSYIEKNDISEKAYLF